MGNVLCDGRDDGLGTGEESRMGFNFDVLPSIRSSLQRKGLAWRSANDVYINATYKETACILWRVVQVDHVVSNG